MKQIIFLFSTILFLFMETNAKNIIKLNPPDTSRGLPLMSALAQRSSAKEFDSSEIDLKDISDLLWAANGINRQKDENRTASSAANSQDIDIYLFTKNAVFLYSSTNHTLEEKVEGDHRLAISGSQTEFANAPAFFLIVSDHSKFKYGDEVQRHTWGAIDGGLVAQNICLFASSVGMAARPRITMDYNKIRDLLKLKDSQQMLLNVIVSYKKQ